MCGIRLNVISRRMAKLLFFIKSFKNIYFILLPDIPVANEFNNHIQGAVSIRKTVLPGMAIPMLKIRRPNGRLIFNMEIAIRR